MLDTVKREDPRIARTRQLILDAFKSLVHSREFESITISDITSRATINRATFYSHFKDKDDLVRKSIDIESRRFFADHLSEHTTFTFESFLELVRTSCLYLEALRALVAKGPLKFEHYLRARLQTEIKLTINAWLDSRTSRTRIATSQSLTSTVISWGLLGACADWMQGESPRSQRALAREVWNILALDRLALKKQ